MSPARTGLVWHERIMWHDTGSGASELPTGGWLEPGHHAESPATKRQLKTCSTRRASPTGSSCSLPVRRQSRSSASSMRRSTSSGSESSRSAAAAMPAASRRSATGPSRSPSSRQAARSRRSTPCSTGGRQRLRARPAAGPPCAAAPGHGLLPVRERRARRASCPGSRGVGRVAVVDWDVHHGNGTQARLLGRPVRARDLAAPGRPVPARLGRSSARSVPATESAPRSTSRCPPDLALARISTRSIASSFRRSRRSAPSSSSSRAASTRGRSTRSAGCCCPPRPSV